MTETSVYRYYDASSVLLYVGASHNPFVREVQHRQIKDMHLVETIKISWFDDRQEALDAEQFAIDNEKPLWNVYGKKKNKVASKKRVKVDYLARVRAGIAEFEALPESEQLAALAEAKRNVRKWAAK
jgi:hypothetical protein